VTCHGIFKRQTTSTLELGECHIRTRSLQPAYYPDVLFTTNMACLWGGIASSSLLHPRDFLPAHASRPKHARTEAMYTSARSLRLWRVAIACRLLETIRDHFVIYALLTESNSIDFPTFRTRT
jgi:hypothetical protein